MTLNMLSQWFSKSEWKSHEDVTFFLNIGHFILHNNVNDSTLNLLYPFIRVQSTLLNKREMLFPVSFNIYKHKYAKHVL